MFTKIFGNALSVCFLLGFCVTLPFIPFLGALVGLVIFIAPILLLSIIFTFIAERLEKKNAPTKTWVVSGGSISFVYFFPIIYFFNSPNSIDFINPFTPAIIASSIIGGLLTGYCVKRDIDKEKGLKVKTSKIYYATIFLLLLTAITSTIYKAPPVKYSEPEIRRFTVKNSDVISWKRSGHNLSIFLKKKPAHDFRIFTQKEKKGKVHLYIGSTLIMPPIRHRNIDKDGLIIFFSKNYIEKEDKIIEYLSLGAKKE